MGTEKFARLIFFLLALAWGIPAPAQTSSVTFEDEYKKKLKISEDIQPLGETPFGENINTYNGAISWSQTDVTLPGTGPTLEVRRTFQIPDLPLQTHYRAALDSVLVDWSLDIPHLETLSAQDSFQANKWFFLDDLQRCTHFYAAPDMARSPHPGWEPVEYSPGGWWHGYKLVTKGAAQDVLFRTAENPRSPQMTLPDGSPVVFKGSTTQNWAIGCTKQTSNGAPGEGFLAVSPDGTRYWIDWLVWLPAEALPIGKEERQGFYVNRQVAKGLLAPPYKP